MPLLLEETGLADVMEFSRTFKHNNAGKGMIRCVEFMLRENGKVAHTRLVNGIRNDKSYSYKTAMGGLLYEGYIVRRREGRKHVYYFHRQMLKPWSDNRI